MGADVKSINNTVYIRGVPQLVGTYVSATDLRAGAALVIAGLAAEGTTILSGVEHIDRGYERLEEVFNRLGSLIIRKELDKAWISNSST
jgi:UDP-N-acetylglucosamine 1-carboxyvinyltransferase